MHQEETLPSRKPNISEIHHTSLRGNPASGRTKWYATVISTRRTAAVSSRRRRAGLEHYRCVFSFQKEQVIYVSGDGPLGAASG